MGPVASPMILIKKLPRMEPNPFLS
jgi:hypothetical protein